GGVSRAGPGAAGTGGATGTGAARGGSRTRRRSPGSAVTSPAPASSARCLAIACRVIGSRPARSVAVAGPPEASAARMARLLGSARAVKTCSATASRLASCWRSGGIEVFGQFAQLAGPALDMTVVGLAVGVVWQLREPGLDHRQPGAGTGRLEGELHVGPPRVILGQFLELPGEPEHGRCLHPFHPHLDRVPAGPPHPGGSAR